MKNVTLYVLGEMTNNPKINLDKLNIYTIAPTSRDCEEYLEKMLMLKYESHYKSWCLYKKKNEKDSKNWKEYYSSALEEELKNYAIYKYKFNKQQISYLMRLLYDITPLKCSYELNYEFNYWINRHSNEIFKKEDTNK